MRFHDARLTLECPDKPGIVAMVANFLASIPANIRSLDQHATTQQNGTLYMRVAFEWQDALIDQDEFKNRFEQEVAKPLHAIWRVNFAAKQRLALLVSKYDHALLEVLWQWKRGELLADITHVISNHPDLEKTVAWFNLPFVHVPSTDKKIAEEKILTLLKGQTDLIGLARYMQILSSHFVSQFQNKIINVHHSFLPAFVGANPYKQAFERGVKLIGATAHYVTEALDEGPIIAQEVAHVSHRMNVEDLTALGRDLERKVFVNALKWHLQDRVIVHDNKTIVFE